MKLFITPDQLRADSYLLAEKVIESKFRPDFMVALWRGGSTIGICIHELLKYVGIPTDHIAIRTSRFTGVAKAEEEVTVHNLGYLLERFNKDSKVLLVDDVFDSGLSILAVLNSFEQKLGDNCPTDIRIATVYYKPENNRTDIVPNYYIHQTTEWIVFPHELESLSLHEIQSAMGDEICETVQRAVQSLQN
jgi:hypoxanthine phosphoribosyltransferase